MGKKSNRGAKLKSKMENNRQEELSDDKSEYDEMNTTELYLSVATSEQKLLSKIFVCVNKFNSGDKLPKNYHVNFVASSKDCNEYKLDTNLMINAKCYVQLKKLLGDERLWMA